jgi:methylmalonyl-CoA/ethylmalonyl-CoA epimerase
MSGLEHTHADGTSHSHDPIPAGSLTEIDHVGLAVNDIEATVGWYERMFGAKVAHQERIESDGVEEALIKVADSYLQILTPYADTSPLKKWMDKNGEGIHHVGYRVANCEEVLEHCKAEGARVVDEHPRTGSRGTTVAFLHPKSSFGALIELVEE